MAWQDIIFTVATDNPLIRTIPLIWLLASGILESVLSFKDKSFFCRTLKRIEEDSREIRSDCEVMKNAETIKAPDTCPIYKVLLKNKKDPKEWLNDIETNKDCFWIKIKNLCINYQQAQFFEILFLQFAIAYVVTTLDGIHSIAQVFLIIGLLFIAIPTIVYVYGEDPMKIYTNKKLRLSLTFVSWILIMGLLVYSKIP